MKVSISPITIVAGNYNHDEKYEKADNSREFMEM